MNGRYVLLGLAPARAGWFRTLAQWATAGAVPVDFVKCVSTDELRAALTSTRPFSAALVDADTRALDRDLVALAAEADCPVLAVDRRARPEWRSLGVAAVLSDHFSRDELMSVLRAEARPLDGTHPLAADAPLPSHPLAEVGRLVCCLGPGGTGVSTLAAALAQALATTTRTSGSAPSLRRRRRRASAEDPLESTGGPAGRPPGEDGRPGEVPVGATSESRRPSDASELPNGVVLVDFCRHADQALLHDARQLVPGVQELVEAARAATLTPQAVRELTYDVPTRHYSLLLGLRRPTAWSALRPRAITAATFALRRTFATVVVDADGDVEGEREGGSLDVEERNGLSRAAALDADVVLAVGRPGLSGLHRLLGLLEELRAIGVEPARTAAVVNMAPRSARARSELRRTFSDLLPATPPDRPGYPLAAPILVPERSVEAAARDVSRLPEALVRPLGTAVASLLTELPTRNPGERSAPRVEPGALGAALVLDDEPFEAFG